MSRLLTWTEIGMMTDTTCSRFAKYTLAELRENFSWTLDNFINDVDEHGFTRLFYAIRSERLETVNFLLANGADVRGKSIALVWLMKNFADTPPRVLNIPDSIAIFDSLLSAGADPLDHTHHEINLLCASVGTLFFARCLDLCRVQAYHSTVEKNPIPHTQRFITKYQDISPLGWAFIRNDFKAIIALKRLGIDENWANSVNPLTPGCVLVEKIMSSQFPYFLWCDVYEVSQFGLIMKLDDRQLIDITTDGALVIGYLAGCIISTGELRLLEENRSQNWHMGPGTMALLDHLSRLQSDNPLATLERGLIHKWSLYIIFRFSFHVCIALQNLQLPALLTMTILQALLDYKWPNIAEYHYDLVVTSVKHFHDEPTQPCKRRLLSLKN